MLRHCTLHVSCQILFHKLFEEDEEMCKGQNWFKYFNIALLKRILNIFLTKSILPTGNCHDILKNSEISTVTHLVVNKSLWTYAFSIQSVLWNIYNYY